METPDATRPLRVISLNDKLLYGSAYKGKKETVARELVGCSLWSPEGLQVVQGAQHFSQLGCLFVVLCCYLCENLVTTTVPCNRSRPPEVKR